MPNYFDHLVCTDTDKIKPIFSQKIDFMAQLFAECYCPYVEPLKKAKLHLSVAVLYFPTGMPLVAQPAVANLLRWQRDGARRQAASCEAG